MGNKKLSLWDDILNPKQGKKAAQEKPQTPEWEVTARNADGTPGIICKNGKEWLDADKTWISPSGEYMLHEGMDANANDVIALTRKDEGLRIRKIEELVASALITDAGTGYALTEDGVLHILTAEKASQRKMCEDYGPNACLIAPELCAVIYDTDSDDDLEAAIIKVLELETLKGWKKKIKYRTTAHGALSFKIELAGDTIVATMPDGNVHKFRKDGKQE